MESDVIQLPVSDKLWAWFQTHQKQSVWGASILAVAGLVIWFVLYQSSERQIEASEALSNVALAPLGGRGPRPDMAEAYLRVAGAYPGSSAGGRALLLAAGTLFTEGKFEEARVEFQRFAREYYKSPLMGEALLGVAASLEAQGNVGEAITAYKNLIERHPGDPAVLQAKFALASLYEAQNKPELASSYFEEVAQADPYGSIGSEAGMRAEELKMKYPQLAPPSVSPAGTAPRGGMLHPVATPGGKTVTNLIPPRTAGSK